MPKKRSSTATLGSAAESAPRRSSRVSLKPGAAVQQVVSLKVKKAQKLLSSTKKPNQASHHATQKVQNKDASSSLSDLPSEVLEKADHDNKLPPKKKPKLEKPNSTAKSTGNTQKSLGVGDVLKDPIHLKNQDDEDVEVLELLKEKGAVIFLYPKANTPGCTTQACGYRDIYQEIVETGFQVFGLSMDTPKSQRNWQEKQNLPYSLLCDPKQSLIRLLGGSKSATQVQRSHYILEAGGKILDITSPASTKNSPKEALEFIKSL